MYCWIIPESPRWLHTVGRRYDADKVVRRIARFNRNTLPDDWRLKSGYDCGNNLVLVIHIKFASRVSVEEASNKHTSSIMGLFNSTHVRAKTLIIYGNWYEIPFVTGDEAVGNETRTGL